MTARASAGLRETARLMTHYMEWANALMLESAAKLPPGELEKPRQTLFGTIVHTFNHILVIEDIFRAHLEGRVHDYTARNTQSPPPFETVRRRLEEMDKHYVGLADRWTDGEMAETIRFQFVGGGDGAMTRAEILLHLANHATYHRGFVSDMFYQVPHRAAANDLTVFLRDAWAERNAGVLKN
jgi:uncharacterized damage-inducible protein DinB